MKKDIKKYHHYSLSFYGKQANLYEVSNRVKLGFNNLLHHQKLKAKSIELFVKFSSEIKTEQQLLLQDQSQQYIDAFVDIIKNLSFDKDLMEFVLPTFDAILSEERKILRQVVTLVSGSKPSHPLLENLKSFLYAIDARPATTEAAIRLLATIYGELAKQDYQQQQKNLLLTLLSNTKNKKLKVSDFCYMNSFVHLIKHEQLAIAFVKNGGVELLIENLNRNSTDLQIVYYTFLNIWLISFIEEAYTRYLTVARFGIIRLISQILQKISRDKLVRVAFFIFKNLKNNPQCLELMMDVGLLKVIDTLLKGNIKDKEIIQDIKEVGETLENNIKIVSSYQKYCKQLNAECFDWSAVHTERFWKENAIRFEDNDYQMIKKLNDILNSPINKNVAIACFDLGEFARFYPHGKNILQSLKVKEKIMDKAKKSEDKSVRQQALMALQKIMIQNWQAI